ncbi:MAG: TonB C-terminal domain-containing protein [Deltaproteobacteria bacterium]|nr:TonB C-terminal domain-containing protein [Deltaproteobacteria bacterium]
MGLWKKPGVYDSILQSKDERTDVEMKTLERFFIASAFVHIFILVFDPSYLYFKPKRMDTEMVIEADLIPLPPSSQEKDVAAPRMLPQVPKKFQLDLSEKKEELALEEAKKETKPSEEQEKKDETLRKVSMDRLMKEIARLKAKDTAEKGKIPRLSKTLKERKEQLAGGQMKAILSIGDTENGYTSVLRNWILRYYTLPEIFGLKDADIKAVVRLVLNREGTIQNIRLERSSTNTLFDELAMKTVRDAAPFPHPPQEWVGKVILLPFEPKAKE